MCKLTTVLLKTVWAWYRRAFMVHRVALMVAAAFLLNSIGCVRWATSSGTGERIQLSKDHSTSALRNWRLYTDPETDAARWWQENRLEYPDQADIIRHMAKMPTAHWLTMPTTQTEDEQDARTTTYISSAAAAGELPVVVLYAIVGRDVGGYSRGGANSDAAYHQFVDRLDLIIGRTSITLIVEPDALAHLPGLSQAAREERIALLRYAMARLSRGPNRFIYLDAGHAGWLPTQSAADLLRQCGVERARGFSLNISNFRTVAESVAYAGEITRQLGGNKAAVIDTSRCGSGPASDNAWCNPPGRALGPEPTTHTTFPIDALLWIKRPWESDGAVNGAPHAGDFHLRYALELARNAGWR